jgi:hypothetical protein
MRCVACNVELTDLEATRKGYESDEYLDMCNKCCAEAGIIGSDREDLITAADEYTIDFEILDDWYQNHTSILDDSDRYE